jgi:hypothetical protein
MKRLLCLASLSLLAACATNPPPTVAGVLPTGDWLTGMWLMIEDRSEHPVGCSSGLPISYSRDGRYSLFEESGTWRLAGDRLTETATEVHDGADPAEVALDRPQASRIERLGPNAMRKSFASGLRAIFLRCPSP